MDRHSGFCRGVVIAAMVLAGLWGSARGEIVTFNDANLEYSVREELGIPEPTPITTDDMLLLTGSLWTEGVQDLTGLQYATNLAWLNTRFGGPLDLLPLASLTQLWDLELSQNVITDLSPLSGLANLRYLDVTGNEISDIGPLAGLTHLTRLNAPHNNISDISSIVAMGELTGLGLGHNAISDISAIATMGRVRVLRLEHNAISDISALADISFAYWGASRPGYLDLRGNPLNQEAYDIYLPLIEANNPDALIYYDPVPEPGMLVLLVLGGVGLLGRRRR